MVYDVTGQVRVARSKADTNPKIDCFSFLFVFEVPCFCSVVFLSYVLLLLHFGVTRVLFVLLLRCSIFLLLGFCRVNGGGVGRGEGGWREYWYSHPRFFSCYAFSGERNAWGSAGDGGEMLTCFVGELPRTCGACL